MNIVLIGMNHRTAPVEIRELLAISCEDDIKTIDMLKSVPTVLEALYLSTCNRIEVVAHVRDMDDALKNLKEFVFSHGNLPRRELERCLYVYRNEDAARHLFRVAASLDSMVMGEPQILGQVKDAYRRSVERDASGVILNRLLHHAFRTAKRVRTETAVAGNAVSVSYAAVELAKRIFGSLNNKTALLVGAGDMAELSARHLMNNGVGKVIVANRTYERACSLAGEFQGEAIDLDHLVDGLGRADIIISSTGSPGYVIQEHMIESALRRRKNRLLFLMDIAVPRDIEPSVGRIDNVYLYNIDNLQEVVDRNMRGRLKEAEKAEAIIDEEVEGFSRWARSLEVVPTIVDLRGKVDGIIAGEMERAGPWIKGLHARDRENVDALVRAIINKVLHDPVTGLKEESENGGAHSYVAAMKRLFRLENGDDK
ncbi:MAG: glutamyl-tRNA reductase [Deltaproteobacteria bacterium]|nr:glutamyl-tRNA reductase [Deltaproteobacteria bacterium]